MVRITLREPAKVNPIAKFLRLKKPKVIRNRKKYTRKEKHKTGELS